MMEFFSSFSYLCDDSLFPGEHIKGCFGSGNIQSNMDIVIQGFLNTAFLSITALIIAIISGILIGTLRTLPNGRVLPFFATIWVEVLRNIPLLVQLFLWYFVMPKLFPALSHMIPAYLLVILGLGFFTSARIAEQVRSGLESIPTGQRYAAMAVGFTTFQTYRYVLLPRALRTIMPPLISESMGIIKNSAAAFAVGIPELLAVTRQATDTTSLTTQNYLVATIIYVCFAMIVFAVMSSIERMLRIPGLKQGGEA